MYQRLKNGGWPYANPPNCAFELNRGSPQARGLVAWWPPLGSAGANVLRDFGGRGLDGAFPGGAANPSWVGDGQFGNVLSFDGGDYTDISSIVSQAIATTGAWAAWIKPGLLDINVHRWLAFSKGATATNYVSIYTRNSGEVHADLYTTAQKWVLETDNIVVALNQWTHVVMVHNSVEPSIYIDGVKVSQTFTGSADKTVWLSGMSGLTNADVGTLIYNGAQNASWNGAIADIRIYNRALSPAVIWDMAHDKKWELYKPLRRWWAVRAPAAGWPIFGPPQSSPIFGGQVVR